MPVNQEQVRLYALSLPGVEESSHQGRPDLRVGGKIFATLPQDGASVNAKIAPDNLFALVDRDPSVYSRVWGERWIGINLQGVDLADVEFLIEDAWRLTAPKKVLKEFDGTD